MVDGHYLVSNDGSEIRLRPDRVAHVADSLQAHYAWKRSQNVKSNLGDHLDLAEWCIQHGLWGEASRELLEVRTRDPRSFRLPHVERRLERAWRLANAKPAPSTKRGKARHAMANEIADAAEAAQQLRLIETLPEGSLEHFTRRIQPILVNNCTTAGCHQPGGDESFQLNRDILHGLGDRRSTFANLASVLAAINRDNPAASPLLAAGTQPHGGKTTGLLVGRRGNLNESLAAWVKGLNGPGEEVARTAPQQPVRQAMFATPIGGGFQQASPAARQPRFPRQQPAPATPGGAIVPAAVQQAGYAQQAAYDEPVGPQPGQPSGAHQQGSADASDSPAMDDPRYRPDYYERLRQTPTNRQPAKALPGKPDRPPQASAPATARVPVKYGAQAERSAVRDEFDPEIFNQQYRREQDD